MDSRVEDWDQSKESSLEATGISEPALHGNKGQLQKKSCSLGAVAMIPTLSLLSLTGRTVRGDEAPALCSDTAIPREARSTQQPSTALLWSLMVFIPTPTLQEVLLDFTASSDTDPLQTPGGI